jgi:hypothetical protein
LLRNQPFSDFQQVRVLINSATAVPRNIYRGLACAVKPEIAKSEHPANSRRHKCGFWVDFVGAEKKLARRNDRQRELWMRTALHQFFRPTQEEFKHLWKDALISFDASVLLNIYGYSDDTRDDLVKVLINYSERVRLPYQFAFEYAKNRASVIDKQIRNYIATENDFKQIASKRLQPKTEHPYLTPVALEAFKSIQRELEERRASLEKMISSDEYADVLLSTFDGRVGPPPTDEELPKLHAEAKDRFAVEMPPGYKDLKVKAVPDAYGDYIAWNQLMALASKENRGVILVIDDVKEDWWQIQGERTIGPRPELLEELDG